MTTRQVSLNGPFVSSKVVHKVKLGAESKAERRARWKREDLRGIRRLEAVGMTSSTCKALAMMRLNYHRKYGEWPS
ncbi:hypothetical protein MesoLj113a_38500 [Mesorhizobium sp. 113-1-2]|uniref:hypothetical protein n=1 Tax=Mesorhizobium sp. 113-1-2 TaxID=2744515 RepID=UPI001927F2BB|nr:hypothetical protein [Mesorhizobium sp. 113-1-2]BCG72692.1 hypothetical protein MesoLj113a_38500 [Mesorhizobium sp. 113-1-2]